MFDLENAINDWKQSFSPLVGIDSESVLEMEAHLRELAADLCDKGLSVEEAFIIGARRLGHASELEVEFAKNRRLTFWAMSVSEAVSNIRPSVSWLMAGIFAVGASLFCMTLRVPNAYLDAFGLQLIVLGLWIAAITCGLISVKTRALMMYPIAWCVVAVAFCACVILT